jgi:hypothetical protein
MDDAQQVWQARMDRTDRMKTTGLARGSRDMYGQLLILIEGRIEEIVRTVVQEMQTREEIRHYLKVPERSREERIGNVIRDMCERLGYWLNRENPDSSLSAHYSRLGAQRCREGIPLEEVVLVILFIKRGIWDELKNKLVLDNSFTLNHLRDLENNYHLFLDRMVKSIIRGYVDELQKEWGEGGSGKVLAGGKKKCKEEAKRIPKPRKAAKEEKS